MFFMCVIYSYGIRFFWYFKHTFVKNTCIYFEKYFFKTNFNILFRENNILKAPNVEYLVVKIVFLLHATWIPKAAPELHKYTNKQEK